CAAWDDSLNSYFF
nr:immunoglobulin light chain junction region [Macaca mulatta]